ncbi:Poly(ADP-ribose) polymerase, catalytic domain-containing protein [Cynara cardunculus var. scolymus]|uniref:Poly(ADP-ribose) polymerase, catalytic domain-containing protein n=1 Tax=Cynara cardunculus var. scolymus TaxID=59895 RepID=A0A103XY39_CYNCS|nr:Poly(ADP-ribose) polymerase, catalytic domain-containing protein [Cynara cardunculus var. scolymus]
MPRSSLLALENEDQNFEGDNGDESSGFGGDSAVDRKVIEDIASMESYDADDEDIDDDAISDCKSCTYGSPISDTTKIHPQIGLDRLVGSNESEVHPENFVFENLVDEPNNLQPKAGIDGLIRLNEDDRLHEVVRKRFISGMKRLGVNAQIEHIYRNLFNASAISHARLQTFNIYAKAAKHTNWNQTNIRYAWFGASKDDIEKIISHGFSHDNIEKDGAFGYGLYLCTYNSLIESVKSSTVDDKGIRYILLCRVIWGRVEVVKPGSKQCHPSSDEFQLGVDNLELPKKLIIWSTQLNTHILPEFVISFKILSGSNGPKIERVQLDEPVTGPWMPIKALVSGLSKILPPEAIKKIDEYHRKYIAIVALLLQEHKISRHDMLLGFRDVAGDRLLLMVVKDFKEQEGNRWREPATERKLMERNIPVMDGETQNRGSAEGGAQDLKQAKAMDSKANRLLIE